MQKGVWLRVVCPNNIFRVSESPFIVFWTFLLHPLLSRLCQTILLGSLWNAFSKSKNAMYSSLVLTSLPINCFIVTSDLVCSSFFWNFFFYTFCLYCGHFHCFHCLYHFSFFYVYCIYIQHKYPPFALKVILISFFQNSSYDIVLSSFLGMVNF